MAYPIEVHVHIRKSARARKDTFCCRFPNGVSATSTNSPQLAVELLMDKIWKPGTHRATQTDRIGDAFHFKIFPIEEEGAQ